MHPLVEEIRAELTPLANREKAEQMARYLKYQQELLGVPAPAVQAIVRKAAGNHQIKSFDQFDPVIRDLWNGQWREERYAALALCRRWKKLIVPEALPLYEWMVLKGQWWDLVDGIAAGLMGGLMANHPSLHSSIFGYIHSDNLWLRRCAILCQLNLKGETNTEKLSELILVTAHEKEFFIRKAIGWALRQYARQDPEFVRSFVSEHQTRLSGLSRREALKNI